LTLPNNGPAVPLSGEPAKPYLHPMTTTAEAQFVSLSERAAKRISAILSMEAPGAMLRVAVKGGGCSGFQYEFDITTARNADDLVLQKEGAVVLVDPVSVDFMKGAEIDFSSELIGAAFKINNPNATSSCGCGTSFSV
jgi:iron-sulfur cluster assembly accessory protein